MDRTSDGEKLSFRIKELVTLKKETFRTCFPDHCHTAHNCVFTGTIEFLRTTLLIEDTNVLGYDAVFFRG
jgi:hypothetical protein